MLTEWDELWPFKISALVAAAYLIYAFIKDRFGKK
jgi:hypothetical protein